MDCLGLNGGGHLTIGGCDTLELAAEYGTPLYVMDETAVRAALRAFKTSLEAHYENGGRVAYASKACSFKELYRIVADEGCGSDVVSGGELYTAVEAGFPADRLYFHGNNKSDAELRMALEYGVGRIVVDNLSELEALSAIAGEMGRTAAIQLRITPGVEAHTHEFVQTGQVDSKFGLTLANGDALTGAKAAAAAPHIELKGIHCHIGSQIFDGQPFIAAAEIMLGFMAQVRDETGISMSELNLGGGFGIKYTDRDAPLPLGEYMAEVSAALHAAAETYRLPVPFIIIEPGRAVAAPAGITLYTVGSVKDIPGVHKDTGLRRRYVIVDGGMPDNPRYALYKAEYTVLAAGKAGEPASDTVTVAGRCCETGDLIQEFTPLQPVRRGDILAVLGTGAYNYAMSSNYNRLPRPAIVITNNGVSRVALKRETYDDIVRNDV